MIDRQTQPQIKPIDEIEFVAPRKMELRPNVYFYHMKEVQNETVRFDLYFDAGKSKSKGGISSFVNGLLLSGTNDKSAHDIEDTINGLGGFYEAGVAMENAAVTVYCLRENLKEIATTLVDAIKNVNFDDKEVKQYLADRKQKLRISKEKVNVLAQRRFQQELFASNELYANVTEEEDIDKVTKQQLIDFHHLHYRNGLSKIVLVGNVSEEIVSFIIDITKDMVTSASQEAESNITSNVGRFDVEKEGAIQSAIRVGKILFNKQHQDYLDFLVLNTILGDYFGSRLMSNIREDKGYTYGVGSAVAEFNEIGYFLIVTEVGKDVKENTLTEIQNEVLRLQNELVSKEELELVKNYMLGQLLKSADGPYAMMDLFLSAEAQNKSLEFYNDAIESLNTITPERIQELANKYLNWNDFTIVTAG